MKGKIAILVWLVCCVPLWASEAGGEALSPIVEYGAKSLNFIIFAWILFYFLKDAVRNFFVSRQAHIKESLELAERSREEAKRRLEEIEQKMSHLDEELATIEQQARDEMEREKQRIHQQAEREAERILAQAKAEVENMTRQALIELRREVARRAIAEAETKLAKEVGTKERNALFDDFTASVEAGL